MLQSQHIRNLDSDWLATYSTVAKYVETAHYSTATYVADALYKRIGLSEWLYNSSSLEQQITLGPLKNVRAEVNCSTMNIFQLFFSSHILANYIGCYISQLAS